MATSTFPARNASAQSEGTVKERIVAALKRSVREAPDKRRRIQEFDDGDAQFAHGPYIVVRYESASTATLRRPGNPQIRTLEPARKYSTAQTHRRVWRTPTISPFSECKPDLKCPQWVASDPSETTPFSRDLSVLATFLIFLVCTLHIGYRVPACSPYHRPRSLHAC